MPAELIQMSIFIPAQRAKKVVSDSPGLVDFAKYWASEFYSQLVQRAGKVFWGFHCYQSCSSKTIFQAI